MNMIVILEILMIDTFKTMKHLIMMMTCTIHTIAWDDMIREVIMILGNHSYCYMSDFDRDKTCIYCMKQCG